MSTPAPPRHHFIHDQSLLPPRIEIAKACPHSYRPQPYTPIHLLLPFSFPHHAHPNLQQGIEAEQELVKLSATYEALLNTYHALYAGSSSSSGGGSGDTDAAAEQQPDNEMISEMRPPTAGAGLPTDASPLTRFMTASKFAHATWFAGPPIPRAPTGAMAHENDALEGSVGGDTDAFDEPQSEKCSALENDNSDDGGGHKEQDALDSNEDGNVNANDSINNAEEVDNDSGSNNTGDRSDDDIDNGSRTNDNRNGNRTDDSNNGNQYDDNDYENDNDENGDNGDNNDKSNDYDHDAGNNGNDENHYGWTMDRATSLKVGEVLRRKMYSPDGTFAAWPGMDGSIMFGRYPTTPPPEDDGYSLREMDLITTLHRSDHGKVWRALDLRAELQKEEKDKAEGLPQETRHGAWWKCLHWGRPSERERERARQHMGEIAMSIDDRAGLVSQWASRVCCL